MAPEEDKKALAEYVSGLDVSWISPVGVEASLETLVSLPEQYDAALEEAESYRIADVGCGEGQLTAALAERYPDAHVLGIDVMADAAYERTKPYKNVHVVAGDATTVLDEYPDFDFVYGINILQDFDDFEEGHDALCRAVGDDGYLAVTVPGESLRDKVPADIETDENGWEYWQFDGLDIGDQTISYSQYLLPEDEVVGQTVEKGFEVQDKWDLAVNTGGLPAIMEMMGQDIPGEVAEQMRNTTATVPLYLFRRTG